MNADIQKFETNLISNKHVFSLINTRHFSLDEALKSVGKSHVPIVQMDQIHQDHYEIIETTPKEKIPRTDAIISRKKNILLCVKTADCIPVLIYHPSGWIGAVHAGRKGSELGILKKTLEKMKSLTNTNKDFQLFLGPHICESCYEIDKETKTHYSLKKQNIAQLKESLLQPHYHIHQECTACHNSKFFSYRKEGEKAGRFFTVIMIEEK